jgi:hypothetical protein
MRHDGSYATLSFLARFVAMRVMWAVDETPRIRQYSLPVSRREGDSRRLAAVLAQARRRDAL